MDKIDLDAIYNKIYYSHYNLSKEEITRLVAKEAIRQALILASEKATYYHKIGFGRTNIGVEKQSILDIEKLIV